MLVSRVQQVEVTGKICVTEDEVKQYYEDAQGVLHDPAAGHAARDPRQRPDQRERRQRRRRRRGEGQGRGHLRKRLEAGEPFAQLASELSDSGSKANGGLIGPISRTDLSPELLKEIDAAEGRAR